MPTSVNEITGDRIVSKSSDTYRDNWELVFGKKDDILKDISKDQKEDTEKEQDET